jgi:hypothetical protein
MFERPLVHNLAEVPFESRYYGAIAMSTSSIAG